MKAELYRNCSLVRIPVKAGEADYTLPQNVEWADRKIDRMVICAPAVSCTDPVDGVTPVMTLSDVADCYITLYDKENREIMHDVLYENILHLNNNPIRVDAQLNLSLCRITFTTPPAADGTLLLYVFYDTKKEDYAEMPKRTTTVAFPLSANQELSFKDIINFTIHAIPDTVKGVIVWSAAPAWLTLRDHDLTYQMVNIHTEMMRPDMNGGTAYDSQAALFLLDDLDIDFDYSRIREAAGNSITVKMTFLY